MQNRNYYLTTQDNPANGDKNKINPSASNLYLNFIRQQQQQQQSQVGTKQPALSQQDLKLKEFLLMKKNPDTAQNTQDAQAPPSRPSNNSATKINSQIKAPEIERICTNFKKTAISKQQQLDDGNQTIKTLNDLPSHSIITIQSLYRKKLAAKKYKLLLKRQRYRRSVVNELVTTEKQYLSDLKLMILIQNDLKQKSQTQDRIIGSHDIKALFQNLDAIEGLSEQMLEQLIVIQQNFNGTTKIGNQMKQFASFFKFYFEYCNNYIQAQKLITQLKKENPKMKDFVSNLEKTKLKGSPFEGYLIKPVQRVPKYVLLLKDLLKNTSNIHCDYDNISKALEQFIKVNDDNNKNMDKLITNQKIFELQKQFGNQQVMIVDAKREFKSEESLKIFYNHEARPVIVYFLTDLVLVTEREEKDQKVNYKLLKYIYLDQNSYGQELDDSAHISYLFRLIGKNETVTFIADNLENKLKFITYINILIDGIRVNQVNRQQAFDKLQVKGEITLSQNKYPVLVKVLGTQEVYESSVNTFTQYIISVEISNIVQKIFIRFSHLLEIQKQVQTQFPKLKLPYFKDQTWLGNHDVKVIEGRKIQMMDFLQTLLTLEQMQFEGQEILKQLGLPQNFYELPEVLSQLKEVPDSLNNQQLYGLTKKPTQIHSISRKSSAFQSYFNNSNEMVKNELRNSGFGPSVISPRGQFQNLLQPIKPQHTDEKQDKSNQNNTAELPDQDRSPNYQMQQQGKQSVFQRSNSQQQRKYSATKLARGSLPLNKSSYRQMMHSESEKKIQMVKIQVQILTFPKPTEITIDISPETRGTDAFEEVLLQVNLQIAFDFKLYIQEKNGQRPIEDDESLWTLLVEKQIVQSATQKITQLVKRVTSHIYKYNQKPVILKKHLYLPEANERHNFEDTKRVELLAQQTFMEITNNQLKLNDTEYTMFTALRLYLDGVQNVQTDRIPFNKIQEFLPPNIFKKLPRDNWQYMLPDMLKNFEDEVRGILLNKDPNMDDFEFDTGIQPVQIEFFDQQSSFLEQNRVRHSKQLTGSDFGVDAEIERLSIGQMVFLKLIASTQFYGFKIFELTPDKETKLNLQKICQEQFREYLSNLPKSAQNLTFPQVSGLKILLCVGYDQINIYSNHEQFRPLIILKHSDIVQVKAHPLSLLIQLQPQVTVQSLQIKKSIQLHFDTGQSFVIQMLIQEYQEVRQTIEEEDEYFA